MTKLLPELCFGDKCKTLHPENLHPEKWLQTKAVWFKFKENVMSQTFADFFYDRANQNLPLNQA